MLYLFFADWEYERWWIDSVETNDGWNKRIHGMYSPESPSQDTSQTDINKQIICLLITYMHVSNLDFVPSLININYCILNIHSILVANTRIHFRNKLD